MPNAGYIIENQMADPSSAEGIFELPCGLLANDELHTTATLREISGHEEDILASKKVSSFAAKMGSLIARCTTSIGGFKTAEEIAERAENLLIGDRVYLILAIRRVSLGDIYPFQAKCPDCGKESLYDVDLSTLEVKKMPNPKKRVYEFETSRGLKVQWHPMSGKDEIRLESIQREKDKVSLGLLARIDLLDGKAPTLEAVKGLSMKNRNDIRDAFEESEGGVDTAVEMTCPKCECEYSNEIGIGQKGFFFPSAVRRSWKSKHGS